MDAKRVDPTTILIREFRLIKGQIDSPFDFKISNIESFDFEVDFDTSFNLEEGIIKADFIIQLKTISKEALTDEATSTYHFVFLYHLNGLNEHITILENERVDWNPFLANAIASITYSTSRGILVSRFQGTVFEDFILPVVDPNELIKDTVKARTN